MPIQELGSSVEAPNGAHAVGTTLLRKHKILPRPRENSLPEIYSSTPATKPRDLVIDTGISSIPSSDTSSPRTLKHASKRISVLPPTPPTHSRQSSSSQSVVTPAPKFDFTSISTSTDVSSVPSTPTHQRSPPTPDVTPPRAMPMAFRPPSDRYPSSRTDSFKTALEIQESSEEEGDGGSTVRPVLPSARTSAVEVPQAVQRPQKRKEIGLGLGLESDNEGTTTPRGAVDSPREEFVVFDGDWASNGEEISEVEREWDDNLMRNVTVRKRRGRPQNIFTNGKVDEVVEDDIVSPTLATKVVRNLPLHERIARHRLKKEAVDRTQGEKLGGRVAWPLATSNIEAPSTPDVRRFSTMSGRSMTSTVVEAIVVDAPPRRRKTLRHTKKQIGLRDVSSDLSTGGSASNSVISNDPPHRLHHALAKIPERKHRSLSSNATLSTTSSSGRSRREILKSGAIPVVIIPDRRSSTKSSKAPSLRSTSSRKTKRSMSLNSAPLSQSSKFNEPGYFDNPEPRKRTMSESAGSDSHTVRTIDHAPHIPARRSSLSAPTSRNTSRAGSLTAESLKAHNTILAKNIEAEPKPVQNQPAHDAEKETGINSTSRLHVDHNGDPFFGNRLSTQATPFSQASYETAGTMAEVSEALAVSIYPHQNKSLLLVQQRAASEPSPPTLKDIDNKERPQETVGGNVTIDPVTPPQPVHPMDAVDSPLRNPRAPPEPPAIKFIPPTPAGYEEDRQLGHDNDRRPATSDERPKRSMSLMRRAFSHRRNSELSSERPSLIKRTFSLRGPRKEWTDHATQTFGENANPTTLYPSVVDRPADGAKLHPFWRPANFWDDLEDQDDMDDNGFRGQYPAIDNRPSYPKRTLSQKLKRTFAILPIQDDYDDYQPYAIDRRTMRRAPDGNLRVVKQRSNSSLKNERRQYHDVRPSTGPAEGTFGYGFKDGNGGRVHTIPGLGVRIEYVGWNAMKRRISEHRREQRSEKLRASISGPRGVQSGVDDVLRTRT